MRALILKDTFILKNQMRFFMILMLFFALMPNMFMQGFSVVYGALIPVSVLAYDERSKWNQLAAMMPYTERDMVVSKYMVGLMAVAVSSVIAIAARMIYIVTGVSASIDDIGKMDIPACLISFLAMIGAAIIIMSVNIPLLIKLGAEKGRLAYLVITVVFTLVLISVVTNVGELPAINLSVIAAVMIVLAAVMLPLSMNISGKLYDKERQ